MALENQVSFRKRGMFHVAKLRKKNEKRFMKKVLFGIIGIGNMGSSHFQRLCGLPEAEVVALCDCDPSAFERLGAAREQVTCFTDCDRFLAEGGMDAVLVATPHYFHPELGIKALAAGKHLLVEKPIAVHKKDAERLLEASRQHPELKKSLMLNQRTLPAHRKIKEMIDSGQLGNLCRISWTITDWFRTQTYYDSGDWRASWRGEGGGVLLNQCPHQLDLMQWFFGLPNRVRASASFGKFHDIEVEDEVNAFLEYPNGLTGNFIASTGEAPGINRLEIAADRGLMVFEKGILTFWRNEELTSEFIKNSKTSFHKPSCWQCNIPIAETEEAQHTAICKNFIAAIVDNADLIAPLEEGIRGLELGNAMLLSAWRNETVQLPIDTEDFEERLNRLVATSRYRKNLKTADNSNFNQSF